MSTESFGLRPRNIGELLDLTYRCYRKGFATFAVLGIAVAVPAAVFNSLSQTWIFGLAEGLESPDPGDSLRAIGGLYLRLFVLLLVDVVIYSAGFLAIYKTTEDVLLGRPISVGQAFDSSWRRVPAAIGTGLIVMFLVGIGFVLCCLPAIPVLITLSLATPLVYLETRGPLSAISRSYELVWKRGPGGLDIEANWLRMGIVALITGIVFYVLSFVAGLPLMIASLIAAMSNAQLSEPALMTQFLPLHIRLPLEALGAFVNGALLSIVAIPLPLMYYDIRTRHEGLDLEMQARDLATEGGDVP